MADEQEAMVADDEVRFDIEDEVAAPRDTDRLRCFDGRSPWPTFVMAEIRRLQRRARMTERQALVFECYCGRGFTVSEIANTLDISKSCVYQHLRAAYKRAEGVRGCGLLTVMVETMGWDQVAVWLADLQG